MIFCRGCGKEIHESAISCPNCGAQQITQRQASIVNDDGTNNIFTSYINAWKTAFIFKGRVRRKTYWYFILAHVIITIILAIVDQAMRNGDVISTLYSIAILVPAISMGVKRMHDVGKCGWWIIVPFVNLYYAVKDSDQNMNEYGPSPKYAMA
jgi:uncharacterized membrane protein YhaH (DUF805 family)